jgi:hypothetical protein
LEEETMLNDVVEFGVTLPNRPAIETEFYPVHQPWGMLVKQTAISGGTLVLTGRTASWVMDVAKKLEALGRLPAGWDSYGGLPLDPNAKKLAVSVLGWLGGEELPVPAVVLGSGGTVQLEWRANGKELEVELGKDNSIEFVKVNPNGDIEEGEERANLPQRLRGLTWWLFYG